MPLENRLGDFALPGDTPRGKAVFVWIWYNNEGNREMYMNSAHLMIDGGGILAGTRAMTLFDCQLRLFAANVGSGCETVEGRDLMFPNPGVNVTYSSDNTLPPRGQCLAIVAKNDPATFTSVLSCAPSHVS